MLLLINLNSICTGKIVSFQGKQSGIHGRVSYCLIRPHSCEAANPNASIKVTAARTATQQEGIDYINRFPGMYIYICICLSRFVCVEMTHCIHISCSYITLSVT